MSTTPTQSRDKDAYDHVDEWIGKHPDVAAALQAVVRAKEGRLHVVGGVDPKSFVAAAKAADKAIFDAEHEVEAAVRRLRKEFLHAFAIVEAT